MSPPPAIDACARAHTLAALLDERFDLAIVGGGITGAGLAREAALRGLRVALLEAGDFAGGTSSKSSKLIHGGLRYLAMGDVPLVRHTALERKVVHRLAPHLAEPRWMLVPTRSRAGLLKFRAAIGTYEKLGAVEPQDRHQAWDAEQLAREEPALDRSRFGFACAYREYLTDDARLVLANLRAAVGAGARALSYAPVVGVVREGERAGGVLARCSRTGAELRVRARAVVNAAGPWVDEVAALERPGTAPRLHLSKGVHVVLPASRLPVRHLVVLQTDDGRSIFAITRGDAVYLGTTDTSFEGAAEPWPPVTREDVEYLLAPANRDFAVDPLRPEDVVAAWAGLRPLVAQPGRPAREISRKDELWVGPLGVVSVAGGKLTGYRPMAQSALDRACQVAGLLAPPLRPEEGPPLPGGDLADLAGEAASLRRAYPSLDDAAAARLVRLYGSEARDVAALGAAPLAKGGRVLGGEVDWAVRHEGAETLEDVVYRRTRAALYEPGERMAILAPAAARLAAVRAGGAAPGEADLAARMAGEADALAARMKGELAFRRNAEEERA